MAYYSLSACAVVRPSGVHAGWGRARADVAGGRVRLEAVSWCGLPIRYHSAEIRQVRPACTVAGRYSCDKATGQMLSVSVRRGI